MVFHSAAGEPAQYQTEADRPERRGSLPVTAFIGSMIAAARRLSVTGNWQLGRRPSPAARWHRFTAAYRPAMHSKAYRRAPVALRHRAARRARALWRMIRAGKETVWPAVTAGPRGSLLSLSLALVVAAGALHHIDARSRQAATTSSASTARRAAATALAGPPQVTRPAVPVAAATPAPFTPSTFATLTEAADAYGYALWEPRTLTAGVRLLAVTTAQDGFPPGHRLPNTVLRASYGVAADAPLFVLEQGWGVSANSLGAPSEQTGVLPLTFGAAVWTHGHRVVSCDLEVIPLCVPAWGGDELVLGTPPGNDAAGWRLISETLPLAELGVIAGGVAPVLPARPLVDVSPVLYVVETPERAERLKTEINLLMGNAAGLFSVMSVTNPSEELALRQAIGSHDQMRELTSQPAMRVIDLRGR